MYYKIKELLVEHLPDEVGISDFANIIRTEVFPNIESQSDDREKFYYSFIQEPLLLDVLIPTKGKIVKRSNNKKKMQKNEIIENLFRWIALPDDYIMSIEELELATKTNYEFKKHILENAKDNVNKLDFEYLLLLEIKNKYDVYKKILVPEKFNEYVEMTIKCFDEDSVSKDVSRVTIYDFIELVIKDSEVFNNALEDPHHAILTLYTNDSKYNKLYQNFNETYTQEDYDVIKFLRNYENIDTITIEHIKKYNNYLNSDKDLKFINKYIDDECYMYLEKEALLAHANFNKIAINVKILIYGRKFILENKFYKRADLKYLVDENSYYSLDEKERAYFNKSGILTEELVDIIDYNEIIKNNKLTKELLNYIARDTKKLDISKNKIEFTVEDCKTYPNLEYSILNQKLTINQLERNEINYHLLDVNTIIKSKKLIQKSAKNINIEKLIKLLEHVKLNELELSNNTYEKLIEYDISYLYQLIDNRIIIHRLYKKYASLVKEYRPELFSELFGDKPLKEINHVQRSINDTVINFEDLTYQDILKIVEYNKNNLLEQKQELLVLYDKVVNEYGSSTKVAKELQIIIDALEPVIVSDPQIDYLKEEGIIFEKRDEQNALSYIEYNTSLVALKYVFNMFEDSRINYKFHGVDFRDLQMAGIINMIYNKALRDMIDLFEHQLHCYINYQYKHYSNDNVKTYLYNYELNGSGHRVYRIEDFLDKASLGDLINVYNDLYAIDEVFIGEIPSNINNIRNKVYHHSFTLKSGANIYNDQSFINYINENKYTNIQNHYYETSFHCREIVELLNLCYYFLSRSPLLEFRKKTFNNDITSSLEACIQKYHSADKVDKWVLIHMEHLLKTTEELSTFDFSEYS